MILSNNNGTFTPTAGGTGTFVGTTAAFNAIKDTLPDNTVAYITDDGAPVGSSITADPYSLPVTIPANSAASIGEITLTPGSWIVIASGWNFVDTPADILYVCLNSDWFMSSKPSNGWEVVGYYTTAANKVVKVNAYNSTNSAMAVTNRNWRITAIRLA